MTNGLTMRIKNDRIRLMNEIKEMKNVMPCDLVAFQATYPGEVTSINLILSTFPFCWFSIMASHFDKFLA